MKTTGSIKLDFEITFTLNETEIRALDALAGYGLKEFLRAFYEKMGRSYLEPHEQGLKTLFEKARELKAPIAAMDELRKEAVKVKQKFNT